MQPDEVMMQYDPGEVLSPSQANCYLGCSARWRFKYLLGLKDPPGGGAVRGKAVHKAVEYYMRARIAGVVLEPADVMEHWDVMFDEAAAGAEFASYENVEALKTSGATLAEKYLTEAAPHIEPAAVELPLYGMINGVPVRGFADILTTDGTIIDLKTSSRKPSSISGDHALQIATYIELAGQRSNGIARIDALVSTKEPQLIQIATNPGDSGRRFVQRMYPMIVDSISDGRFMPNRGSLLCSRCPYSRECEVEFGGTVA